MPVLPSVIGWNHPGFGASSGTPTPESEAAAIAAILEFATVVLGYDVGQIILLGWSIVSYCWSLAPHLAGYCISPSHS